MPYNTGLVKKVQINTYSDLVYDYVTGNPVTVHRQIVAFRRCTNGYSVVIMEGQEPNVRFRIDGLKNCGLVIGSWQQHKTHKFIFIQIADRQFWVDVTNFRKEIRPDLLFRLSIDAEKRFLLARYEAGNYGDQDAIGLVDQKPIPPKKSKVWSLPKLPTTSRSQRRVGRLGRGPMLPFECHPCQPQLQILDDSHADFSQIAQHLSHTRKLLPSGPGAASASTLGHLRYRDVTPGVVVDSNAALHSSFAPSKGVASASSSIGPSSPPRQSQQGNILSFGGSSTNPHQSQQGNIPHQSSSPPRQSQQGNIFAAFGGPSSPPRQSLSKIFGGPSSRPRQSQQGNLFAKSSAPPRQSQQGNIPHQSSSPPHQSQQGNIFAGSFGGPPRQSSTPPKIFGGPSFPLAGSFGGPSSPPPFAGSSTPPRQQSHAIQSPLAPHQPSPLAPHQEPSAPHQPSSPPPSAIRGPSPMSPSTPPRQQSHAIQSPLAPHQPSPLAPHQEPAPHQPSSPLPSAIRGPSPMSPSSPTRSMEDEENKEIDTV
ncbi:hypothetical protein BGX38DRAFT_1142384 [Terfezia claveryi]|nr:hypothetical protein BGX38DRAFT_1142384 [Terfezia claveryi]